MNRVALAFTTRDRVELTKQSVEPLLQLDRFDLWWIDGSTTSAAQDLWRDYSARHGSHNYSVAQVRHNVTGGSCRTIVYALTEMLASKKNYTHVGLVENDQLLDPDWFEPTMALFDQGTADGLQVGAVSARCYEDRILCQRDGYALMHNLGAGMIVLTRQAAELILNAYRTMWTTENRRAYAQLSGLDIGAWWAFRAGEHMLVADWAWDRVLSTQLGLASLALTPSPCRSLDPGFSTHGLTYAAGPVEARRNDDAFARYVDTTARIRRGELTLPDTSAILREETGTQLFFSHQLGILGGEYAGDWRHEWSQAFGPFAYRAGIESPSLTVLVSGPCSFLLTGGQKGGRILVEDLRSGYAVKPMLPPTVANQNQIMQIVAPCAVSWRPVRLTALDPGVIFYGLQTREAQPLRTDWKFDHSVLPPL